MIFFVCDASFRTPKTHKKLPICIGKTVSAPEYIIQLQDVKLCIFGYKILTPFQEASQSSEKITKLFSHRLAHKA
jgi:hypothetical protein